MLPPGTLQREALGSGGGAALPLRPPPPHLLSRADREGSGRLCPPPPAHCRGAPISSTDRWRIEHFSSSGEFCGFSVNRRLGPPTSPRSHRPERGSPLLAALTAPHPAQGAPILPGPCREKDRLGGGGGGCAGGRGSVHAGTRQPWRLLHREEGLSREAQRLGHADAFLSNHHFLSKIYCAPTRHHLTQPCDSASVMLLQVADLILAQASSELPVWAQYQRLQRLGKSGER